MGSSSSSHNLICSHRLQHKFIISSVFCLILVSTQLRFIAEGRTIAKSLGSSQEEKAILRGQIGSRPPRCERRCSSCGHCEAIQVPTNPQIKPGSKNSTTLSIRGDYNSNYKPMSWKCKCGNLIFNP